MTWAWHSVVTCKGAAVILQVGSATPKDFWKVLNTNKTGHAKNPFLSNWPSADSPQTKSKQGTIRNAWATVYLVFKEFRNKVTPLEFTKATLNESESNPNTKIKNPQPTCKSANWMSIKGPNPRAEDRRAPNMLRSHCFFPCFLWDYFLGGI